MGKTIITRIGWCQNCFKEHRPHIENEFLAHGSNGYKVKEAKRNGLWGFVPTNYVLDRQIGGNVIVYKSCAMYGCGVIRTWVKNYWEYSVDESSWARQVYTLSQWNGLVLWKHDNQYWI